MKIYNPHQEEDFAGKKWIQTGLVFGLLMYVFNTLLLPLFFSDWSITWKSVLLGIPIWVLGGLAYGCTMKLFFRAQTKD